MAGITFGNRISTTTQDFLLPKAVDHVLNSNVLFTRFVMRAKQWRGENMKFPIKVSKNTTGESFSGFDTFSTSASDTRRNLQYTPSAYQITVSLPLDELTANKGEEKVLDLIATEIESSANDMADDLGTQFYGTGTGKDFNGLELLVDDGTNNSSIGGLTRSDFTPNLDSTVTAAGSGNLSLTNMRTLYSDVSSGSVSPTAGYTTETVWDLYESLLQSNERIIKSVPMMKNGQEAGTGFTALHFAGFPILKDEKATSGVLYYLNENFLDFHGSPMAMQQAVPYKASMEGNDYSSVKGLGFSWSGWIVPANAAAIIGHIYFYGQFTQRNPKRSGKLTGVTGTA